MKTRAIVVLGAIAGTAVAANAQSATWSWDWIHVDPVNFEPIANPADPNAVSPGEAALIRGSLEISGIGTSVENHQGFQGTIGGIGQTNFNLNAGAGHDGTFDGTVARNPAAPGGDPVVDPDAVRIIAVGQLPLPGMPLFFTGTSFENAVQIRWTPDHYDNRIAEFTAINNPESTVNPTGVTFAMDRGGNNWATYRVPAGSITWGGVNVPVVPSPSSLALLGLGGLIVARRRR